MLQIILMIVATVMLVCGIVSIIQKILDIVVNNLRYQSFIIEVILIIIGLSYLIWFCN